MDLFKESIIVLGAGQSQLPLIKAARSMGLPVIAIDRSPEAVGFSWSDVCINRSTHHTSEVLKELRQHAGRFRYKGVLARTTDAQALNTSVAVADEFKLPGLSDQIVQICTDKPALRRFCNLHSFPVPWGMDLLGNDHLERIAPECFPLIVKPAVTRIGKTGVHYCRSRKELPLFIAQAGRASGNGIVEIQSFVEGIDITCLCWFHEGQGTVLACWDELVGIDSQNRLVGLGARIPSVISDKLCGAKLATIAAELASFFPEVNALLLISFRITRQGEPYIIEIHADLGGDQIAEMLWPAATSYASYFEMAINVALRGYRQPPSFTFQPSLMCYTGSTPDASACNAGEKVYAQMIQKGSIRQDFSEFKKLALRRPIDIMVWPLHPEWLEAIECDR